MRKDDAQSDMTPVVMLATLPNATPDLPGIKVSSHEEL